MLPSWCRDTVTVKRAPVVAVRGSEARDWNNAASHTVAGCSVQHASVMRDFNRAVNVSESWTLYAPPGADIEAGDRIEWNGHTFEINGAPYAWTSPTGRVSSVQVPLVEWKG